MVNLDLASGTSGGKDGIARRAPSEAVRHGLVSVVGVVGSARSAGVPYEPAPAGHDSNGQGVCEGPVRCEQWRLGTIKTHYRKPRLQVIEADSAFLLGHHHLEENEIRC